MGGLFAENVTGWLIFSNAKVSHPVTEGAQY